MPHVDLHQDIDCAKPHGNIITIARVDVGAADAEVSHLRSQDFWVEEEFGEAVLLQEKFYGGFHALLVRKLKQVGRKIHIGRLRVCERTAETFELCEVVLKHFQILVIRSRPCQALVDTKALCNHRDGSVEESLTVK